MPERETAIVFAGGEPLHSSWRTRLPPDALVIAADSGLDHARAAGVRVHLVVGDLDSVSDEALAEARAGGVPVDVHDADKDATDLELALGAARAAGVDDLLVVGVGGGRTDHLLANTLLLAAPELATLTVRALVGPELVTVVRGRAELRGSPGSLVTLLPVAGAARGVSTTGLRWTLSSATLAPGTTRGVSNLLVDAHATVLVEEGCLLALQPEGGTW